MDMAERVVRMFMSESDWKKYVVQTESEPSETEFRGYFTIMTAEQRKVVSRLWLVVEYDPDTGMTAVVECKSEEPT